MMSVDIPDGESVSVYKDLGGDGAYNYDPSSEPEFIIDSDQDINIKRGLYVYVIEDKKNVYEKPIERFYAEGKKSIKIDSDFNQNKLGELLTKERSKIRSTIVKKYPQFPELYKVSRENLFKKGDWYGAYVEARNSFYDDARIILNKQNGQWSVATDPPQIIIGEPSHKNIPIDVIREVNTY
jgi:hypothetical protein